MRRDSRKIVPFRSVRRRRRWQQPRRGWRAPTGLRPGAFWTVAIAAVAAGYSLFAPILDDWRSGLRTMTADCRVTEVIDGDTVDLACRRAGTVRGRIVGYDSPELFSPRCEAERQAALRAKDALAARVHQASSTEVAFLGHDRYARVLVDMRLGGRRVTEDMVAAGHGRRYFGHLRGGWC